MRSGQDLGDGVWLLLASALPRLASIRVDGRGLMTGAGDGAGSLTLTMHMPGQRALAAAGAERLAGVLGTPAGSALTALDLRSAFPRPCLAPCPPPPPLPAARLVEHGSGRRVGKSG